MIASFLESTAAILTVAAPLVAVPLTVITFYLRSLREHQLTWHADLMRRIDALDASIAELRRAIDRFERDYTTKEEWLRECMIARRALERLTETTVRLDAAVRLHNGDRHAAPSAATKHESRRTPDEDAT